MVTAEVVDPLLAVLKRHGVARFRCGPGGSFEVEFHTSAEPVTEDEPARGAGPSIYPQQEAPEGEGAPKKVGGHRPLFGGLSAEDPLFDHVRGPTGGEHE